MKNVKINFVEKKKIVQKYKDGATTAELAAEYGTYSANIWRIVEQAGVTRKSPKFDCDLADTLRKEYEDGATSTGLAKKYNTTPCRVLRYIREAGGTIRAQGSRKSHA
jgi:hypothetical protein